jgi:hypothetical protein
LSKEEAVGYGCVHPGVECKDSTGKMVFYFDNKGNRWEKWDEKSWGMQQT